MARGYTTRNLQVFALHGHIGNSVANYSALLQAIKSVPTNERCIDNNNRIIAITKMIAENGIYSIVVYEGERGLKPIIFNSDNAEERIAHLRNREVVVSKTHAMIDPERREAIIEYNHRGAKAQHIAKAMEEIADRMPEYSGLDFELTPIADDSFTEAIGKFERIRLATLRVAKPNVSWTDEYNNVNELANESDATTIEVSLTAHRSGTLRRERGIVGMIKGIAAEVYANIKSAKIIGTRIGESAETSISLSHHIEHQHVNVRITANGHVDESDIIRKMQSFRESRSKRNM